MGVGVGRGGGVGLGGAGAEAEQVQRGGFVLCGQVIKGSWCPSASPSPPTKEQNSSYF